MADRTNIQFFKGANVPSGAAVGAIWFKTSNRTINVKIDNTGVEKNDWQTYSGLIDITFADNKFTITKANGDTQVISFAEMLQSISDLDGRLDVIETWKGTTTTAVETLQNEMDAVEAKAASNESKLAGLSEATVVAEIAAKVKAETDRATGVEEGFNTRLGNLETTTGNHTTQISGLDGRIAELEGAVGEGGSVGSQIDAKIAELDSVQTGDGTFVDVTVTQVDGKITKVEVAENDIASATTLANEITRATNADAAINAKIGGNFSADSTVAAAIAAAQKAAEDAQADIDAFYNAAEKGEAAIDTLKEIQDFLTSDNGTVQTLLDSVDANKTAIDKLNGTGDGSVAKAVADAKDSIVGTLGEGDAATLEAINDELDALVKADADNLSAAKTYADGKAAAAQAAAEAAAAADATTKANKAKEDAIAAAKEYADGLADDYDAAGTAQGLVDGLNATVKDETGYATATVTQAAGKLTGITVDVATGSVAAGVDALAVASDVKTYVDEKVSATFSWVSFE